MYVLGDPVALVDPTGMDVEGGDKFYRKASDGAPIVQLPDVVIESNSIKAAFQEIHRRHIGLVDHGSYGAFASAISNYNASGYFYDDPSQNGNGSGITTWQMGIDEMQMVCDLIGMTELPGISQAADLISAGISAGKRDGWGTVLGVLGTVPGLGLAATATKWGRRVESGVDAGGGAMKAGTSIWSSTSKLSSVKNAFGHWKKHAAEFPEYLNAKQYVEGAQNFLNSSPPGTLMKTRANGDILKYHPSTNTFGVLDASGVPRTMFRPTDGMKYWLAQ